MKIFFSLLKFLLALWSITGASYMMGHYADLATPAALAALSGMFWIALGVIQIGLSIALILSLWGRFAKFSSPVALTLAMISLSGSVLYSAYTILPGMLIWAIAPAILYIFVAYKK